MSLASMHTAGARSPGTMKVESIKAGTSATTVKIMIITATDTTMMTEMPKVST